jgi:eukaryotic-like serine/threonine-protein kinase
VASKGTLLGGRYRVVGTLGAGGMATVFLCEDERLGREVAVKRLHAHSPTQTARRFMREAKLGASLNHPNLVTVYDTVTDEDAVLIVMELVRGESLADALRRGPLGTDRALGMVRDLAGALDHAHGHGVIHRDVKPANVLLREDGMTKLVDLGIATAADHTRITQSGILLGTAAYMAPEQLDGREVGPATDRYALAVLAFEALSGARARSGRTPLEIAHQIANDGPPDLREVWDKAPPEAAEVLCRAMAIDPEDRPGSAGELADELEKALEGAGDTSTEPTRKVGPSATLAGAGAAGAVAGAAAAADRAGTGDGHGDAKPTPVAGRREPPRPPTTQRGDRPPPPPPRRGAALRAQPAGRGRSRALPVALALIFLALAAVVAVAALSGGGDDGNERTADSGRQQQAGKPKEQKQDQAEEPQAQQPAAPAPAEEQVSSGQGTDAAGGAQLNDQGYSRMQQGDYAGAVPILREAVASWPEDSRDINYAYALFNLGKSLNRSGNPGAAIPYLEKRLTWDNQRETVQAELDMARRSAG